MGHVHWTKQECRLVKEKVMEYREKYGDWKQYKRDQRKMPFLKEVSGTLSGRSLEAIADQFNRILGIAKPRSSPKVARIGTDGRRITYQGLKKMSENARKNNEVRQQQLRARIKAVTGATEDQLERILNPKAPKLAPEQIQYIKAALVAQDSALCRFTARQDGTVEMIRVDEAGIASFRNGLRPEEKMDKLAEMVAKA